MYTPSDLAHFEMKKCLNVRQKLGTRSHSLTLTVSHSLTLVILNNFCFHVYAQKSLSRSLQLSHSHTISLTQCLTLTLLLSHFMKDDCTRPLPNRYSLYRTLLSNQLAASTWNFRTIFDVVLGRIQKATQ